MEDDINAKNGQSVCNVAHNAMLHVHIRKGMRPVKKKRCEAWISQMRYFFIATFKPQFLLNQFCSDTTLPYSQQIPGFNFGPAMYPV